MTDEPQITYQHIIGEQQIEIYMLRRELAAVRKNLEVPVEENGGRLAEVD